MTDSIAREINERSARNGLEIMYRTWWCTKSIPGTQTDINIECRKAVSRGFRAFYMELPNAASQNTKPPMKPAETNITGWQYRAGNLHFPNQPLTGNGNDESAALRCKQETQYLTQMMFNKMHESHYPSTLAIPHTSASDEVTDAVIYPADLERSTVQDLAGYPFNNSRVLAFQAVKRAATQNNEGYLFLQYLKVARIFLQNTEIEE